MDRPSEGTILALLKWLKNVGQNIASAHKSIEALREENHALRKTVEDQALRLERLVGQLEQLDKLLELEVRKRLDHERGRN